MYKLISFCAGDEGISKEELQERAKSESELSGQGVDDALDFLSEEGHIYSTIDDDHFKAID